MYRGYGGAVIRAPIFLFLAWDIVNWRGKALVARG